MNRPDLIFIIDKKGNYYGLPHITDPDIAEHNHYIYYTTLLNKIFSNNRELWWSKQLVDSMTSNDSCLTIPKKVARKGLITGFYLALDTIDGGDLCFFAFPDNPSSIQLQKSYKIVSDIINRKEIYYFCSPNFESVLYGNNGSHSINEFIKNSISNAKSSLEV